MADDRHDNIDYNYNTINLFAPLNYQNYLMKLSNYLIIFINGNLYLDNHGLCNSKTVVSAI